MRRVFLLSTVWAALAVTMARAQGPADWVQQVLPERAFDAGTVAKGSKVRHTFLLVNRLNQDVRIANWRTKCGCTEVKVGAQVIPPGAQTSIEAVIDTTRFDGYKPSGLTLVLDRPNFVEVDLNFSCFIRSDVVVSPGVADFGIVTRTTSARPTLALNLNYGGGQPNWGITRMQTRSARVSAKLQERSRSGSGQVQYLLTATLDPAGVVGYYKDEITLYTNDHGNQSIPVSVTANVQAAVTVSPSPLILGQVKPGQVIKKTLLVKSARAFKLTELKTGKEEITAAPDSETSRPLHTVNLTIKVPSRPGPYHAVVEITTDLKDEPPAKLTTFATIVP